MQLAVSTYSFQRLFDTGRMTQLDCIEKAKELGFDAVEFVDVIVPPGDGRSKKEYARALGDAAHSCGLAVSNFTFSADLLCGEGGTRAEIERIKGMLELAALTGAKSVRHDAAWGPGAYRTFDAALPHLAEACRQVAAYAQTLGIRTMVENHGTFCQESSRMERLYTAVDHPNFGLLVDIGNFLCADESPASAVGRLAPYAAYVHAKDFHIKSGQAPDPGDGFFRSRGGVYLRGAILGHGDVPVRQCLAVLKQAGYQGAAAIEFEGLEDPLQAIPISLANLRRFLQEA